MPSDFWEACRNLWRSMSRRKNEAKRLDVIYGPENGPAYPDVLAKRLETYRPNRPAFPGGPEVLEDAQIKANLAQLLETRAERLRVISALCSEFGVDLSPLFDPSADPIPTLEALEDWLADYLPARADLPPDPDTLDFNLRYAPPIRLFRASSRDGDEIAFSLVADLALAIGETIRLRKPGWDWAIDFDPENGPDGPDSEDGPMPHYRCIVLANAEKTDTILVYELHTSALGRVYQYRSRSPHSPTTYVNWTQDFLASEFT